MQWKICYIECDKYMRIEYHNIGGIFNASIRNPHTLTYYLRIHLYSLINPLYRQTLAVGGAYIVAVSD